MDTNLIKCPFCEQDEYVIEREDSILLLDVTTGFGKECNCFCTYCKMDFLNKDE